MTKTSPSILRYYFALFFVACAMLWGLSSLSHGPKPKGIDAPLEQFSAMRAFADLQELIGNDKAHPSGSAENLRIRKAIEAKFTTLGYAPEIQKTLGCTPHYPGCTEVENIIVLHKGTGSNDDIIMLTSHYDSVPAGAAAADDGAGMVTMLEIARIINQGPALKNDILFLITDGEEGGLRGAAAFFDEHPLMKRVKLVVNLESRGVSGPSNMFETSDNNLELIRGFARANKYPIANSLSYEIYSRLPNDTDYSIYKPSGVMGLNFAFTGDVALYHSKRDNLENLDKASLQHHGENMLAAVKAFGNKDMASLISTTNATYIDIFGKFIIHWPATYNLPLAIFALIIFGFAGFKTRPSPKNIIMSVVTIIAALALSAGLGWLLSFPLGRWPDLFYLDHPHPWPGRLAMMAGALLVSLWLTSMLKNKLDYTVTVWTTGIVFGLAALGMSIALPGASYMFLIPALGMAFGALIDIWRKHENLKVAAHMGLILMAYMAFYHFIVLEVIVHYKLSALRILPLALLGISLIPIFLKTLPSLSKYTAPSLVALTAGFAAISFLLPGFNITHPRMQNIVYIQGHEEGKAIWVSETSGKQDAVFTKAAGLTDSVNTRDVFNVLWGSPKGKPANIDLYEPPKYTLIDNSISNGIRTLTIDIVSLHGGYSLSTAFRNAAPKTVIINGVLAANYEAEERKKRYHLPLAIRGAGKNTYRVVITMNEDSPIEIVLIDSFNLLPEQLEGMDALRPEISAPLHSGDRAHIFNHIIFKNQP